MICNTSQVLYKTTVSWRACCTETNSVSTDSLLICFALFTILWAQLFTYRQYTAYVLSSLSNLVFLNVFVRKILSSIYRAHNMQLFLNWVHVTFYAFFFFLSYTMLVMDSVIKGFRGWKLYTHKQFQLNTKSRNFALSILHGTEIKGKRWLSQCASLTPCWFAL